MSGRIPERMSVDALASELRRMADAVEIGDSLEGSIEYSIPYGETEEEDAAIPLDARDVVACYRVGNLHHGQGFMHIIGSFEPPAATTPTEH